MHKYYGSNLQFNEIYAKEKSSALEKEFPSRIPYDQTWKQIPVGSCAKFFMFFHLSGFLFTVNSKYFFNSWCCILDYFILNCKLWDKLFNSMIILNLIVSYILMFYRNFELIFEFMALKRAPHMWPKRLPFFLFVHFYI